MKRDMKKKGGLYEYLDERKVLETGTGEDIEKARKEYWRIYKAAWRRNNRKANSQYTISFDQQQERHIATEARRHKRSRTKYVKEASLAYASNTFLVPDIASVYRIKELLTLSLNSIAKLQDACLLPYQTATMISKQMTELEGMLLAELRNPEAIEKCIMRAVRDNPAYRQALIHLLQNQQP